MKLAPRLARGLLVALVSWLAVAVHAQQRPQGWNWRPERPATIQTWREDGMRGRGFTPPAPRGDLRGDIASNVRERPEPPMPNTRRASPRK
ncbi:hypothetical protein [Paraburkholderia kururiensis]|uniref:DUF4124 domain-containing protein n=1 Tax=Paraburkholderia kururiensis TaxID=984307 RepID=A0ABZ0WSL9_9BURK|nr:hypothetical protein [Paraburkholderia kururiensis]WQD80387.1 hypothetical protein U0042_12270 [Paraburkholderia kururiensis]